MTMYESNASWSRVHTNKTSRVSGKLMLFDMPFLTISLFLLVIGV